MNKWMVCIGLWMIGGAGVSTLALVPLGCGEVSSSSSSAGDASEESGDTSELEAGAIEGETGDASGSECPSEERVFCEACTCDAECGEGGVCVNDGGASGFCSRLCSVAQNNCDPGSFCRQFGNTALSFFCASESGSCDSDGTACSACNADEDCAEGLACKSTASGASWCFEKCDPEATDTCPAGHECSRKNEICQPEVNGKFQAVCHANQRALCEPCGYTYDCLEGLDCVEGNGDDLFCSMACQKFNGIDSTCPDGMFCTGGYCKPPIASLCQGWLTCGAANVCGDGEICEKGICRSTCEAIGDCPLGQKCSNDGYCEPLQ